MKGREAPRDTPQSTPQDTFPKTPLRVLVVEDSENDTMLLLHELRHGGYEPLYERVCSPQEMEGALEGATARGEDWQVVISDYYMPRFRGPEALALLRGLGYDTPFIVVSGKIGEEAAVAMMRAGAQDYVTKDNMARLCPAIERELREAAVRKERQEAREALRESEKRFRVMVDTAPVLVWMSGTDALWHFFNRPWLEFRGRTMEQETGNGWAEDGVHPEDYDRCLETYLTAFEAREEFETEYRLRRWDGEYRWVLSRGVPRFAPGGEFAGFIGSCLDITERKEAERRLNEVREAERNRIARDLHDDILQDIVYALQEIQIVQITSQGGGDEALEDAADALRRSVEGLRGAIFELRVGALSRSFFSSLEALLELNRRMSRNRYELVLTIEDGFPPEISERVGRQLTRIVQEALTNVRRHAEARRVEVRLWREGEAALVEVADDGRGFDVQGPGVGQQSMVQRASEIGGELEVQSAPGEGTRVRVRTPVSRLVGAGDPAAPAT